MLKKLSLIFITVSLACAAGERGQYEINSSSIVGGVGSLTMLLPYTQGGDVLNKVVVGRCGVQDSLLQLFDSSGTALQPITPPIDVSSSTLTGGCIREINFDIQISSAISYTLTGSNSARIGIYFHRTSTNTSNYLQPTYP